MWMISFFFGARYGHINFSIILFALFSIHWTKCMENVMVDKCQHFRSNFIVTLDIFIYCFPISLISSHKIILLLSIYVIYSNPIINSITMVARKRNFNQFAVNNYVSSSYLAYQ